MTHRHTALLAALCVATSTAAVAAIVVSNSGDWPDTWPQQLDRFRSQAQTRWVAHGIQEDTHEIPFKSREDFEAAWPHLVSLLSPGAPIILVRSPHTYNVSGSTMAAGVRVLTAPNGVSRFVDEASDTVPPEYVVQTDTGYVPYTGGDDQDGFRFRARTDLMIVVDGTIVDLNRIPFPKNAPVIDQRFPETGHESATPES